MKIQRREFLKRSALGVGGLLGASLVPTAEAKSGYFDPFERFTLGKTKIKVSRLCLGTGMHGWERQSNQTRLGKEKFEQLIQDAYERGIRLFDLADLYGTHPYLIPALKKIRRQKFAVVTKIWWRPGGLPETERPDADVLVARFLKELKTDYIDLLLLHCVTSGNWPTELSRQMEILDKLKQKGVICAHGVSCHSIEALEAAAREPWVDSVHTRINPYGMRMDGPPEKVLPVLKKIHDAGKGVIGMKIIGEGGLRNDPEKRDQSVKFALQSGCVNVLNVGFEKVGEIDDLSARVSKVRRT
jgi:aryl-alcohol dehydrogenase-like predicted oxidoreductase